MQDTYQEGVLIDGEKSWLINPQWIFSVVGFD